MMGITQFSVDGSRLQDIPLDFEYNDNEDDNDENDDDYQPENINQSFRSFPLAQTSPTREDDDALSVVSSIAYITFHSIRNTVSYTLDQWKIVLFGQAISLILACNGAAQATLHFQCSLSAPAFTMTLAYFVLSCFLLPLYMKGRRLRDPVYGITDTVMSVAGSTGHQHQWTAPHWFLGRIPLYAPPWVYLGRAFLDVQANYMTILAFRYTTLTSVTLFDALAIPSAMILSTTFLQRRFTKMHLLGVVTCMWGIVYNILADYALESINQEFPNRLYGDLLAILGGILFGVNDVLTEQAVQQFGGPSELLGMMGFFATFIAFIQALIFERTEILQFFSGSDGHLEKTCSTGTGILLTLAFVICNTLSYVGVAKFLQLSEATLLNLSLLTGDFWAVLFSVVAQRIVPTALFWVALIMTVSGVCIYEMGPSPIVGDMEQNHKIENAKLMRHARRSSATEPETVELSDMSITESSMKSIL